MNSKIIIKRAEKYYCDMKFEKAVRIIINFYKTSKPTLTTDLFLCKCYDQWALVVNDFAKKKEFQKKGIKICTRLLPIYSKSASLLSNLGNIYHHMALDDQKYNKKAIFYYKKALALSKNKPQKTDCLNNIANSYQRMGNLNNALKYYSLGNRLSKEKDVAILYNLSFIYLKLHQWAKCLEVSQKYFKLAKKLPDSKMQTMFRNSIKSNVLKATVASNKEIGNTF
jgi:tetratricopeptide (TPR) repeat protein